MQLIETLAPDQRLTTDARHDQLVSVTDGVLCVALEQDDVLLLPGDTVVIPAGEPRRVWNAGDVTARLVVAAAVPLARAA